MSDCEETDLFWRSLISPGKRKRKKDSRKDKKCKKKEQTEKKVEKKKKKNSKFKEAMAEKKRTKKQKKKKNRSALELHEEKPPTSNPSKHSSDELKPDKKKRKKKVSFNLPPGATWAKRPKSIPSSSQRPKESVLSEDAAAASAGEFMASGQTHDSQLNSEDLNSQDLFITQKTFRASPSEPSSSEASDEVIPRTLSPQMEQHLEEWYERPQESHFHQHHRKMNSNVSQPRTLHTQEEERSNKVPHEHKKGKLMDKEDKKVTCPPVHIKPRVVNPFLDEPVIVTPSLHVTQSKTSTSTQTENLFTTELSSYLSFCRRVTAHSDDLKPLDLSLPLRARKVLGMSVKIECKDPNPHPSGAKDVVVKKERSSRRGLSLRARGKSKACPAPECAETTNSSEDNEPTTRSGKARVVQTKLNESFFFKTKGDGQSPRPESPLMKLAQGRDVKTRKGCIT